MRLESIAKDTTDYYPFNSGKEIGFKPVFEAILKDINNGVDVGLISGKFHNTMVQVIIETVKKISQQTGIKKVALSGGSFQNRILLKKTEDSLKDANFAVFLQSLIPSNDGGIALGQLAIAAKRREMGLI
jgi:hydrogenase maturation protein HypF